VGYVAHELWDAGKKLGDWAMGKKSELSAE
jgi:hypothetical protein